MSPPRILPPANRRDNRLRLLVAILAARALVNLDVRDLDLHLDTREASPLKRSVRSRRRERRGCRRERSSGERSSRSEGSSPRSSSKTPPSNELAWTARSSSRRFAPRRLGRARRFGSAIGDVGPPHSGTSLRSCSGGGLEVGSYVSHESSSSLANTSETLAPTPTLRNSLLASSRSCSSFSRKSSSSSSKSASRGLNSECA